jgi:small subunit ribosomal protein S8
MDTVSDLITTIRNAQMVKKPSVEVPFVTLSENVLSVLKARAFILDFKKFKDAKKGYAMLHVDLSYLDGEPAISEIKKVSKPGRRVYKKATELRAVKGGLGLLVVSTPRGLMSDSEARKRKLGGEVICQVF